MSEFSPGGTFDVPTVKVKRQGKDIEVKTVSLSLRGSGFLVDVPEDNRIYINGVKRPVIWDGCPAPTSLTDAPTDLPVHGAVLNSEQIDLCQVEVPVHRVVTVEVSQENVPRSVGTVFPPVALVGSQDRRLRGCVGRVPARRHRPPARSPLQEKSVGRDSPERAADSISRSRDGDL